MKIKNVLHLLLIAAAFVSCCRDPKVGSRMPGGYVFYIDTVKEYVLIAPNADLVDYLQYRATHMSFAWDSTYHNNPIANSNELIVNTKEDIGQGWENTKKIFHTLSFGVKDDLNAAEFTFIHISDYDAPDRLTPMINEDWFLPSVGEFQILLDNFNNNEGGLKNKILKPYEKGYWTSSQVTRSENKAYSFEREDIYPNDYELKESTKTNKKAIYPIRMQRY